VGASISFPAAGSGGAIIDFAAISEPEGWAAVGFCAGIEATAWLGSEAAAVGACFSATAAVVAATGATTGAGDGLATAGGGSTDAVAAGATEAGGPEEAAGAGGEDDAAEGPIAVAPAGLALACGDGDGGVAFCRAIAPVTESRPCSRTATREYSRSRSPLSVSMAEARRLASL
jgi:hypothetical protein